MTRPTDNAPYRRFTVAEVEAMVAAGVMEEDERVELIAGELVPMSPKGLAHEELKSDLTQRWVVAAPDEIAVVPATTFRLSEDTYLEADILLIDATAGLATGLRELSGPTALLVVEIADSSLRYDVGRKAALYASYGVRELWVIDAVRLSMRVFRSPAVDGYREPFDVAADESVTPLFAPTAFALRLADLDIG